MCGHASLARSEHLPAKAPGIDGFLVRFHPLVDIYSYICVFCVLFMLKFDTCMCLRLYAQVHLDLHTNIVICNAAVSTYAYMSAYGYRRIRVYTV